MITIKWPRLIVVGQPVTEEQADEILIRTNSWRMLFCNDKAWLRTVVRIAAEHGYPPEIERGSDHEAYVAKLPERWRLMDAWLDRIGAVSLEYLGNDQIMSSWIGGPHGWCNWAGTIGCSTHNIGKWPSDEEVTEDWQRIAAAFPYLDLTCQVVNHEEEGGGGSIAGQWRVQAGEVEHIDAPTEPIGQPTDIPDGDVIALLSERRFERGVSEERLRTAFARVAGARESTGADT